jgi:hypothetical protein
MCGRISILEFQIPHQHQKEDEAQHAYLYYNIIR